MSAALRFARLRLLACDTGGMAVTEFGVIAPVFLMLLLGIYDIGHEIYVQSVLQGAVQAAPRDAGLESGAADRAAIDAFVEKQVGPIAPGASYTFSRSNYSTFSDVGRPEDFVDANNNGQYDNGECFIDENGNGQWDDDVGAAGLGGADDVVLYTVTVSYPRLFPLWALIGLNRDTTASAKTTLRNQPFGNQDVRQKEQICPS
jgi:Flp pilus assembly protein TadG